MKKYLKVISFIVSLFVFFTFFAKAVDAQTIPSLFSERDIFITTYPEVPGTFETVDIKVDSYAINLNNHLITWYVDNQKRVSDYGKKNFSIRTGKMGSKTIVTVVISVEGLQIIRKTITISPSEVDLLWEAVDSYTPPFYKGKALPLIEGEMKIIAIPETRFISPNQAKQLVYYWKRDGNTVPNKSGYGRQTLSFQNNVFTPQETIEVTMTNRSENSSGTKTIYLDFEEFHPKIIFYTKDSSGRLLLNQSFNAGKSVGENQFVVSMHPYFMSTDNNFFDILLQWRMNGEIITVPDPLNPTEILFNTDGQVGLTELNVEIEHYDKLFQLAKGGINLNLR